MVNTLLIVRHSERIDESKVADEKASWKVEVANDTSRRNKMDLYNDPILTKKGVEIAAMAAKSLRRILSHEPLKIFPCHEDCNFTSVSQSVSGFSSGLCIDRIYSSRLRRCIETAYQLALRLEVPIYVCAGLALTAVAVERRKGSFEFHSMMEIRAFCPGVQTVSCDGDDFDGALENGTSNNCTTCHSVLGKENRDTEIQRHEDFKISASEGTEGGKPQCCTRRVENRATVASDSTISISTSTNTPTSLTSNMFVCSSNISLRERYIPSNDWLAALTAIAERHPYALIVAHRESIRNLTSGVGLPGYCHTAVFHHTLYDRTVTGKESPYLPSNLNDITAVKYHSSKQSSLPHLNDGRNSLDFVFQCLLDERGTKVI